MKIDDAARLAYALVTIMFLVGIGILFFVVADPRVRAIIDALR